MPFLPCRPDLDQLRHQAKDLLRAAKAGESEALTRVQAVTSGSSASGEWFCSPFPTGSKALTDLIRHFESPAEIVELREDYHEFLVVVRRTAR